MKKSSFEKILHEQKDRVFSYVFFMLGNREDAEDVTQEVFTRLWENLGEIDRKRHRAWIMRVAHNRCIDMARERKKYGYDSMDLDRFKIRDAMKKPGSQTDPESDFEFRNTQRALLRAIKDLPAETRSMLILHYYQGMKYKTIGEMFKKKVNTVKVEVHRGRKRLKEILTDEFPEKAGKV
jgi:RNA polymerase sigma-70 factor (ECF subfamily)